MCNKKGGNQHKIPYTMAFRYVHPPIDNVASDYYVDIPKGPDAAIEAIETVEQAIEVYLQAFYQKFHRIEGRRHRKRSLHIFHQYLTEQGHSLKVKDITLAHGQGFLDSLTNHCAG
jgi:hypothetical protein